jgi:hypothetical protein
LVVGGGLAGLSSALFLAWHAVRAMLEYSPCSGAAIAQDELEPMLRDLPLAPCGRTNGPPARKARAAPVAGPGRRAGVDPRSLSARVGAADRGRPLARGGEPGGGGPGDRARLSPARADAWSDNRASFGVGPSGATLIRPDGHVVWRSNALPDGLQTVLTGMLARLLASPAK